MKNENPLEGNRLLLETSPYLQQHAYNPVDWYPWGAEALERAKQEDKPILVSIGYSACHWCHVMERESFENADTAALMNEHFINIKVDREERPDIDNIYMDAVTAITGSGGWPLNVFLTPELKPFFGGTYFPPVRAHNLNSWREVLHGISQSWREKRETVSAQAENLTAHLQKSFALAGLQAKSDSTDKEWVVLTTQALLKSADTEWGGFSGPPKFPQSMSIRFLLWQYQYFQTHGTPEDLPFAIEDLLQTALIALDKMMHGGIYDQLQGGFARYSTDRMWLAPHFEKMLYDNALLVGAYSHAYRITKKAGYKRVVEQTLGFVAAEWQDEDGGFFSAYDADSEGVEGKYYTWQRAEIERLLDNTSLAELFCEAYDVRAEGNWEHVNILWRPKDWLALAEARGITIAAFEDMVTMAEKKLLAARNKRVMPLLDDKKLMGWNALMVSACFEAAASFGNQQYALMGEKALTFIRERLLGADGRYCHNYKDGKAANPAFLDDLAFYADALLQAAEYTGNQQYLHTAEQVVNFINQHFSDEEGLLYWYTPDYQTDIPLRKKEAYDGAIPSGNSVMSRNLLQLGTLLERRDWVERSRQMVKAFEQTAGKYPNSFATWAQMAQWSAYGLREVAICGPEAEEFARVLLQKRPPNAIFQWSGVENNRFPLLTGRMPEDGKTGIYVCENYACKQPVYHLKDFLAI